MAVRSKGKKKNVMVKAAHHKEVAAGDGGWQLIATLGKDADRYSSWLDSVRITYLLDDRNADSSSDAANLFSPHLGMMFAACTRDSTETVGGESGQLGVNNLLYVTAREGGTGVVNLPIKHRCKTNSEDTDENDGRVFLWMKPSDITTDDDLVFRFYFEAAGRWHTVSGS